jgi:8-oxo-dGTP pyrophosphatase MutT (NUDIX family)
MSTATTTTTTTSSSAASFTFTFSPSLTPYNTPLASYLTANPGLTNLVVSAIIIHDNRALLVQRAPHDGFPLKWECPGGCVDMTDPSILHAVCREAYEETGLGVGHVVDVVDTLEFDGSKETKWRKLTFLVALGADGEGGMPSVCLNDEEHVDAVWAAEEEVLTGRAGGRDIVFAYDAQRQTLLGVLRGGFRDGSERF